MPNPSERSMSFIDSVSLRRAVLAPLAVATALLALAPAASAAPSYLQCSRTPLTVFDGTIVDAAIATPELSTLVSLVVAAGLVEALAAPGSLTVFAPTNAAFGKIPAGVLGAIGGDPTVLTSVLTYHVVAGAADPRDLGVRETHTLQGQTLFLEFEKGVGPSVNQSVADCRGVKTTNGTVWLIDGVLQPQYR